MQRVEEKGEGKRDICQQVRSKVGYSQGRGFGGVRAEAF